MNKKLRVALLLIAAWLLGTALVSWRVRAVGSGAWERAQRIAELGEAQKDLLHKEGPKLAAACAGKLTPQGPHALAGYTQDLGDHDPEVFGTLVAADAREPKRVAFSQAKGFYHPAFGDIFKGALNPFDWMHRLEWARHNLMFDQTKAVAVSAVWDLEVASSTSDGKYDPGRARYYTRVLSFPEGQVLCEGSTTLRMKGTVSGTGRAASKELAQLEAASSVQRLIPFVWGRSVVATPLADLCALAGGKELCEAMAEETGWRAP